MYFLSEHNILIFLIQLFLLLGVAKGLGEMCRRIHQPTITAEIFAGILLGPTILGRFLPDMYVRLFPADPIQHAMLETIAWIGVLFLLLESGLEINLPSVWRQRNDVFKIAVLGIIAPMAITFACFNYLPSSYLVNPDQKVIFSLFMAVVLAITAMPVVSRVLHDLNLSKTEIGFLIMSAHSVNDVIGWVLFTLIMALMTTGVLLWTKAAVLLAMILVFIVVCLTVGRRFADSIIRFIHDKHLPEPSTSLSFICLLGISCGIVTQMIGIHALFGFFIAGIMAGGAGALTEQSRNAISQMVFALFVPLFFVNIGLKVDFLEGFDLFLVILLTVLGVGGKFIGGWVGTLGSKLSKADRMTVAIAHTPGGTIEIVIGFIALENGLITQSMFVAIVFVAIFSSVIFAPWLAHSLKTRKSVNVLKYFVPQAVFLDLKAHDKMWALDEICGKFSKIPGMEWITVSKRGLLEREAAMGTAMEEGVAIPHARIAHLRKPLIVFARSQAGIEWDSPDGKPVKLIFVILNPQKAEDMHLQILVNIAKAMHNEKFREALLEAESKEKVWKVLEDGFLPKA